jgi:hypothetical protein
MACPVLRPRSIPAITESGGSPKAPVTAVQLHRSNLHPVARHDPAQAHARPAAVVGWSQHGHVVTAVLQRFADSEVVVTELD